MHQTVIPNARGRRSRPLDLAYRAADQFGQLIEVVLAAGDYLSAYLLEWTLPHLDAIAHLSGAEEPPSVGTGRRAPTRFWRAAPGRLVACPPSGGGAAPARRLYGGR